MRCACFLFQGAHKHPRFVGSNFVMNQMGKLPSRWAPPTRWDNWWSMAPWRLHLLPMEEPSRFSFSMTWICLFRVFFSKSSLWRILDLEIFFENKKYIWKSTYMDFNGIIPISATVTTKITILRFGNLNLNLHLPQGSIPRSKHQPCNLPLKTTDFQAGRWLSLSTESYLLQYFYLPITKTNFTKGILK